MPLPDLNPYRTCKFKTYYPNGRPRPCRSARCPCLACQSKGAEKQAAILIRSFRDRPPDFALTLEIIGGLIRDAQFGEYLKAFTQRVRDYRKATRETFEYDIRVEFTAGRPHAHLTLITSPKRSVPETKKLVRGMWVASCGGRRVAVCCQRVRSPVALAKYVTKNLLDRTGVERPPVGWNSRKCRLIWTSAKFLTDTKAALWRKLIAEWYGKPPRESE